MRCQGCVCDTQQLIDLTRAAVDRGVFGSPAFFAGDRQFFGKDRMNLFEDAIVRRGRAT